MTLRAVGSYRLLERVGRGAMGEVYRGRTSADGADLAVKILAADLEVDDAVRARFAREARAAAGLRHRNIVRVVDARLDEDPPFIVMEFLRGRSLAARLASGPLPGVATALDIAVQLCEGLHYAHEHGVVHRDVKPANIWLEEDGTLKLLDFGVAHIVDTGLTRHGEAVGSLAYTAPEQLTGGVVDRRADVFAAGVVLFELLSGRRPFDSATPAATVRRMRGEVSLPLDSLPGEVPAEVRAAIARATDGVADNRYDTAADLAVDLRLALLSLPASALGSPVEDARALVADLPPTIGLSPIPAPATTDPLPDTITAISLPGAAAAGGIVDPPTMVVATPLPWPGARTSAPPRHDPSDRPSPVPDVFRDHSLHGDADSLRLSPPDLAHAPASARPPDASGVPSRARHTSAIDRGRDVWSRVLSQVSHAAPVVLGTTAGRAGLAAVGAVLILALIWPSLPKRQGDSPAPPARQQSPPVVTSTPPVPPTPGGAPAEVLIDSQPAGAAIWLGPRDSGLRTPARVAADLARKSPVTLRLPGYEDAAVPIPAAGTNPPVVTLAREPDRRSIRLIATGPYAFDVLVGGRVISAGRTEHSLTFTEGQAVRLRAAGYFLDMPVAVGSSSSIEVRAAGLGDLEVRSARETCLVTIDGRKLDYPPVKQRIAAGTHTIGLTDCPGGPTRVRTQVRAGSKEVVVLR